MAENCSLQHSPAAQVLTELYADAERLRAEFYKGPDRPCDENATVYERFYAMKAQYMPIDRTFGTLMYSLIRASRPQTIVEFGTSFGISTIFLAAAACDNGVGKVITTEFIAEKAEKATDNLTEAGLVDWVEFRVGDAIQTLKAPLPGPVDFLFLDGEKSMYLDVVRLLEPYMRPGCLIASDNTDHEGTENFLRHVRDIDRGYVSSALLTSGSDDHRRGHEVSVRL